MINKVYVIGWAVYVASHIFGLVCLKGHCLLFQQCLSIFSTYICPYTISAFIALIKVFRMNWLGIAPDTIIRRQNTQIQTVNSVATWVVNQEESSNHSLVVNRSGVIAILLSDVR